jgi:hypothetical protein
MSRVGFEPTILLFERAKMFHALDCAATVTYGFTSKKQIFCLAAEPRVQSHVAGFLRPLRFVSVSYSTKSPYSSRGTNTVGFIEARCLNIPHPLSPPSSALLWRDTSKIHSAVFQENCVYSAHRLSAIGAP